jgi:hypothetical protein
LPNYQGCKIPVKTRINVEFFRENLLDYKDKVICEYLEFGAPIGVLYLNLNLHKAPVYAFY